MMSQNENVMKEIDWNTLERCWADRYVEEYGHYFSDRSFINAAIQFPVLNALEATTDSYI